MVEAGLEVVIGAKLRESAADVGPAQDVEVLLLALPGRVDHPLHEGVASRAEADQSGHSEKSYGDPSLKDLSINAAFQKLGCFTFEICAAVYF